MKVRPNIYKKNIYDISFNRLKARGIKVILFDLDNTIALIDEDKCPKKSRDLILKLKKDFTVYIITNNTKKRIKPYVEDLGINAICNALKPSTRGIKKVIKDTGVKKDNIVMIGDQIVTDILSANRAGVLSVLVDPLGVKDLKITGLNRFIERLIIKSMMKKKIFKRGKYYDE